jgi:hypothetical protein
MSFAEDRGSGNKTLLIVFGILGGVLLLALLVCGGLAFFAVRTIGPVMNKTMQMVEDMTQGMAAAQTFLENIRSDQLDDAYTATTDAFQKRMDRQAFEDLVHRYPALQQPGTLETPNMNNPNPQTPFPVLTTQNYRSRITAADGKEVEVQLTVVKEGTTFKVDKFTVRPLEPSTGQGVPGTSKDPRPSGEKPGETKPKEPAKKTPADDKDD